MTCRSLSPAKIAVTGRYSHGLATYQFGAVTRGRGRRSATHLLPTCYPPVSGTVDKDNKQVKLTHNDGSAFRIRDNAEYVQRQLGTTRVVGEQTYPVGLHF